LQAEYQKLFRFLVVNQFLQTTHEQSVVTDSCMPSILTSPSRLPIQRMCYLIILGVLHAPRSNRLSGTYVLSCEITTPTALKKQQDEPAVTLQRVFQPPKDSKY